MGKKLKTKPQTLEIGIDDGANVDDKVYQWKPWFNGMHFFHTIKILR